MVNKLNDGVGKKIVEALKKQSEGELNTVSSDSSTVAFDGLVPNIEETIQAEEQTSFADTLETVEEESTVEELVFPTAEELLSEPEDIKTENVMETNSFADMSLGSFIDETPVQHSIHQEVNEVEMPANILILKKLISQLPSGVTRHTGAQIIKQTMEALGISMRSVLKEAQDVQDGLKESAKECHNTILEYKKQIAMLEKQSQSYQKQYGALNDLISLFIQTTK